MDEVPLEGGNVNAGVVRVGDTVRRATSPHSGTVHKLLLHLENRGFPSSPRFLGRDDHGREVLSYLPGGAAFPDDLWTSDKALIAATKMLHALHDASDGFDDPGGWAFTHPGPQEVICHNDFAPYNMVFEDGVPTGIIDFDLAGPGPRLRDLAYLAYWMAPLSFGSDDLKALSEADVVSGNRRLKLVCATYGTADFASLLNMVSEVLHHMGDPVACEAMIGPAAAQRLDDGGHFHHWQREAFAFDERKPNLMRDPT